jgi:HEAT repeat protein
LAPEGTAPVTPAAALALRRLGVSVRSRVAGLLSDRSPEVRALALRVGCKVGAPEVKPALILEALGSAPASLRDAAGFALSRYLAAHPESAPAVVRSLAALLADTAAWDSRLAAVELLATLGPPARPALESAAARDPSPLVRSAAVTGVETTGGSLATVQAAAADPIAAVRAAAARALVRHRTAPGTEAALSRLRHDPSDLVRSSLEHIEP